jgi:hypothetical protein
MNAAPAAGDHRAMVAKSLGFSIAMQSIEPGKDNFLFIHRHPRHCGHPAMAHDIAEVVGPLPGAEHLGTRTWKVFDIFIDLLRELHRHGDTPNVSLRTPLGQVVVLSVEEVLAERVFSARCWTGFNANDEECARKPMAAILRGRLSCDWAAAARIAGGPE